jgi:hypothetical protein
MPIQAILHESNADDEGKSKVTCSGAVGKLTGAASMGGGEDGTGGFVMADGLIEAITGGVDVSTGV